MLAELLQSGHAQPVVSAARLAPSAFYDLQYRMVVIANAFEIHAKTLVSGQRGIVAARLKLLQFVACRPWLLPAVREWSGVSHNTQVSILPSQRIRRGFISDTVHDNVVEFLIAGGVLTRAGTSVASGEKGELLKMLFNKSVELQLFSTERRVFEDLRDIKITNSMLEGW
jgi:hypothetical protein